LNMDIFRIFDVTLHMQGYIKNSEYIHIQSISRGVSARIT